MTPPDTTTDAGAVGPLCRLVAAVCTSMRTNLSGPAAKAVDDVVRRIFGPLQLAVAGRIKSGKSTVVNALIGRRVSPTDVRECTRLVTRFRYGTVDRVEVVRLDGSRAQLPYDADGMVPADLHVRVDDVAFIDAYLTSALLRDVTVIDTPGLGSVDSGSVTRTRALLGAEDLDEASRAAIASAEAVVFVLTQAARADDVEALAIFRAATTRQASSPINAVGVLNKADQITAGSDDDGAAGVPATGADDPMAAARSLARAQAIALQHRVSDVLPLMGLVAETAEAGLFTEADADALRQIAALDAAEREVLFYSADLFLRPDVDVPLTARTRLLERLDVEGIRHGVGMLAVDDRLQAGELRRRLAAISGFGAVRDAVDSEFRRRADAIKANVALASLESLAGASPEPDSNRIRDGIESLLQRPEAHRLRLVEAASLVASATVPLPEDLAREVARFAVGRTAADQLGRPGASADELAAAALAAARRWRSFASFGSTPAQSRVAHTVHRGYFLLWQELQSATRS